MTTPAVTETRRAGASNIERTTPPTAHADAIRTARAAFARAVDSGDQRLVDLARADLRAVVAS